MNEIGERKARFVRRYWYEKGVEHGNPFFNSRFRVNAPGTSLHPTYMHRSEARGNGMMQILIEENLNHLAGADLYLELWGGHPGTANKRVAINGRSTYALPEVGTADGHCTHNYPTLPLKLTDLVNGYNALQFSCDRGTASWGHFIVDNACLGVTLKPDHPDLQQCGLAAFSAEVIAASGKDKTETISLSLSCEPTMADTIASVDYIGHYLGYDENGNGETADWHGFTKERQPVAIVGTATKPPFTFNWDTSMLPAQENIVVGALVRFKDLPNLIYETAVGGGICIPEREGSAVQCYGVDNLPANFWSRANRRQNCTIDLNISPEDIERAELHVVIWDGGRGTIETPFTLNDHPLPVAGTGRHDVIYRKLALSPAWLRKGANQISLLSDTEHHGIEVLLPGPALVVRVRQVE